MSKSVKSSCWFVRLDGPEEFLRQKCGEMSKWLDVVALLATFHVGGKKENPHCHIVVETTTVIQKQSWAVRIKKFFNVEKSSSYSVVVWDGIRDSGASAYLFHEGEDKILCNKGWSDDDLAAAKLHNAAVQKVVALNKEKASQKLVSRALEHFEGQSPQHYSILEFMLKECRDGGAYYPGEYKLKQYVEEVVLKLTDKEEFDKLVSQVYSRLWR